MIIHQFIPLTIAFYFFFWITSGNLYFYYHLMNLDFLELSHYLSTYFNWLDLKKSWLFDILCLDSNYLATYLGKYFHHWQLFFSLVTIDIILLSLVISISKENLFFWKAKIFEIYLTLTQNRLPSNFSKHFYFDHAIDQMKSLWYLSLIPSLIKLFH